MRTLNSTLDAAQDGATVSPAFVLEWNSTDYTDRLLRYTYRETGQQAEMTEIVLDNRDGALTSAPPPQGTAVTLSRGMRIEGTDYLEELPRLWVEAVTYTAHACTLHCIDFWGKLSRYRYASATSWSNKTPSYIATAILGTVGLSNAGSLTSLSQNLTIPTNQRADRALLRLLDKVPEQAYAGQDGDVYFKELDPDENSVYTFGWQCAHPVKEVERHCGAWRYNSITVHGALKSDGTTYSGSASDSVQIALVGTRSLVLSDASLTTDTTCAQRAQAELDLYAAAADQTVLTVLPCYGLELFDVVQVLFPPWDASGSYTARVGAYTERYDRGTFTQQVRLYRPARTGTEIDDLPEGLIAADAESASRIAPGALAATQVVGTVVRGADGYSSYTASRLAEEFYGAAGRPAQIGDGVLVYESGVAGYRLYVCESSGTWTWFAAGGTV